MAFPLLGVRIERLGCACVIAGAAGLACSGTEEEAGSLPSAPMPSTPAGSQGATPVDPLTGVETPGVVAPGSVAPGMVAPGMVAPGMVAPGSAVPGMVPVTVPGQAEAPGQLVPPPGVVPVSPPGTVVVQEPLHRLNRLEYNNTLRDLLAVTERPADDFPPDPALGGFDNIASGLTVSPTLLSLYADAARDSVKNALDIQPRFHLRSLVKHVAAGGQAVGPRGWSLYDAALDPPPNYGGVHDLEVDFELPQEETVTVSIRAGGTASKTELPVMGIQIDSLTKHTFNVDNPISAPEEFSFTETLAAGPHRLLLTFDNFIHKPARDTVNLLMLEELDIRSEVTAPAAGRQLIEVCDPAAAPDAAACYAEIIGAFARRAWRRPLAPTESAELVSLWQRLTATEDPEMALQLTLRAVLISPRFVYRRSLPLPGSPETGTVPLDDFSLASRLSYFLWASMPDEELLQAAEGGALRDPVSLSAQLERMLADPKAQGFLDSFAGQWLNARKLRNASPDINIFPRFDEPLRRAMEQESLLFFGDFITNGQPLEALLTPDFGYMNDRLAEHYDLPPPGSTEVVRVPLNPGDRGGLVMLGAWLTTQSEAERTSPVLRGRWLTENLLCLDVPPPPPDITPAEEAPSDATVRERLAAHRADPACSGCHMILDPPGLGLEEFDGIGRKRLQERGMPIDTSGGLPGGAAFSGGAELAALLKQDPRFYSCLADKLATYALGRLLVNTDRPILDELVGAEEATQTTLNQLLQNLVLSPAFRMVTPGAQPPAAEAGN